MISSQGTQMMTLRRSIDFVGIGLHSGANVRLTIRPSDNGSIQFLRKDVAEGTGLISARWYSVTDTTLSTVIGNEHGVTLSTVEHLMAALYGVGIDSALVEVDGPEVPIMDGSAEPFVMAFEKIGTRPLDTSRKAIWIRHPIEVREGEKYALLLPDQDPRITISIDFPGTAVGAQTYSMVLSRTSFRGDVSQARTFGFSNQMEALKAKRLARGGSLANAVLVDGKRVVNPEGLRYEDEFVRHKVLDAVGDLALAGGPIIGHYYAFKAGHKLNQMLIKKLFESQQYWSLITVADYQHLTGRPVEQGSSMERVARPRRRKQM
ncbi:MAG: UDP-3-O-acyl-N-acetylglucosamine deacetylase [Gammaproteobacteria bacterium]|nr:UDP-3-O-acyl-N-acetylglucosamine deacetylase [Gammaproteobacteria bacterium]